MFQSFSQPGGFSDGNTTSLFQADVSSPMLVQENLKFEGIKILSK
jgi:hypothetical protein